jgi:hypothetical protein
MAVAMVKRMTTSALSHVAEFQAQAEHARQQAITTARVGALLFGGLLGVGAIASVVAALAGRAPLPATAVAAVMCVAFATMLLRNAASMRRPTELAQTGIVASAVFERVVGSGVTIQVSNSTMRGTISQMRLRMQVEVPASSA